MRWSRATVAAGLVVVALVLQVAVFPQLAWEGIVPDLCLLVVVAAALVRGPAFAATLGFAAGLLLDLAPPADHVAGRWALALVVVGYVAGRVRPEQRPSAASVVATVAASSFIGTSVYALTGLVLRDPAVGVVDLLQVIAISVVWDVLLTPLVLPLVMGMFRRLEPDRAALS
jgi:rod shape-determining protein MreD